MKDPKFSSCCGREATGVAVDMQICPECHDHCTYEEYLDDENEENDMMMSGYDPSTAEDIPDENITGNERELSDDDFPLILDLP